jgi:hypothetical protein
VTERILDRVAGPMTGRGFIAPAGGALLVLLVWLPLKLTHLVVNTSDSLPHNAYAMVDGAWLARRGAYVALVPPAAFQGVSAMASGWCSSSGSTGWRAMR